jgi:hypothetical protein
MTGGTLIELVTILELCKLIPSEFVELVFFLFLLHHLG